jgi:hypothetical protein
MKVAPSYISKETLLKKIEKRNLKRIAEYTGISSAFKPEEVEFIKNNIDPIARIAEKNNCYLEFVPGADVLNKTAHMNVYKKGYQMIKPEFGDSFISIPTNTHTGVVDLPQNITDKESFLKTIKSGIQHILENSKRWNNKYDNYHY